MTDNQGKRDRMEYLRLATPVLIFIVGLYVAAVDKKLDRMSEQILHHLTNDAIHWNRNDGVSKAEFQIYQMMRDKQMEEIRSTMKDVREELREHDARSARR